MNTAVIIILGIIAAVILLRPALYISKVLIKGCLYSALVYGLNIITSALGFTVGINLVSSLIYGFLGIYGVAVSYIAGLLYSFRL